MLFKKHKKIMYVPDEELLALNKEKTDGETSDSEAATEEAVSADTTSASAEAKVETAVETEHSKNKALDKILAFFKKILPSKKDDKKTLIIKIVSLVAAVALIVSGSYLSFYFIDLGQQDSKIENIRNNYELNRDDYTKNDDNQFSKFDILKSQNKDIVGWLTITNTEVNNPVYQTVDNQFYVDHDMDKKPNSYGALFLDYRCDINPLSLTQNQIIYGHNMRYGAMFGTLNQFRELDFYKANPTISFDSLYEQRTYKIFAAMIVNDAEDDTFKYTYTAYRSTFTSENDFMQWIDHSRQRSLIDTTVDINSNDEIITLSTCCYDYQNARFVVMARLVREGESAEVDVNNAKKNDDVIFSKAYYDKKGMSVPALPSSTESTTSSTTSK